MTDAIQALLTSARQAMAERRPADARDAYARAAVLSREGGAPLLQAHALRHLSDIDREGGRPQAALAHAEQAADLYRSNGQGASLEMANALRLRALALDQTGQEALARAAWMTARALYVAVGASAGVEECERRLDATAGN